jgi:hypothetical protein
MIKKRAQVSVEYMLLVSFLVAVTMIIFVIAFFFLGDLKDKLKTNQITDCGNKVISAAETIYYSGVPSKTTVKCSLPDSVIELKTQENSFLINFSTSSGNSLVAFSSKVPLESKILSNSGGIKVFRIEAAPAFSKITVV